MAFPDTDLDVIVEAFLGADPTADPGTWPAATDLSSRLLDKDLAVTAGRRQGTKTAAAGSCSFWLDNSDGALSPLLASSTYYPDWDVGVPVRVSVDNVGASPPYPMVCGYIASIDSLIIPGVGGRNLSVVKVTLGGVLRRLTQGSVPRSAMRRYYDQVTPAPTAYWDLERGDERAATEFMSTLSGGTTLRVEQSTLFGVTRPFSAAGGVTPGPDGAASATDTSAGGRLAGPIPIVSGASVVRAEMSMLANGYDNTFPGLLYLYNPIVATSGFTRIGIVAQDLGSGWQLGVDWTGPGGSAASYASGVILLQDNEWHLIQLDIMSSGGGANTDYIVRVDGVQVHIGTAAGLPWSPNNYVRTNTLAVDIDRICHLVVWSGTTVPTAADSWEPFQGHPSELAHERFERLCLEEGIPYTVTATDGQAVGPQPVGDLVTILQDLETVDHGILSETKGTWGFGYRAGNQRYNLSPAVTIDLSTYRVTDGGSAEVLQPVRNDARLRNEWTVSRPGGGQETAVDAAHQAKRGRFADSAEVNVADDDHLALEASWRVREGVVESLRYAGLPIDLGANASTLLGDWLELELGDRIDRTEHPAEHPADTVSVVVEGYTQRIRRRGWVAGAAVEPFEPWRVQQLADSPPADNVLDGWAVPTSFAVDGADFDAGTDTSMDVAVDPPITTDAGVMPLRIKALGVLLQVTAVGAPSGGVQTLTITQEPLNGVHKTIPDGTALELADPLIAVL